MQPQRGFTLLEMMVVMVLMGLVTTLALPAMQRWHDAVQRKAQAATIIDALRAASFSAVAKRREIVVDSRSFTVATATAEAPDAAASGSAPPGGNAGAVAAPAPDQRSPEPLRADTAEHLALALPAGWVAQRVDDIGFLANGLCRPGMVELRTDRGDTVVVEVRGPLCGVELGQGGPAAAR
jgi:prepilin-type N-terminal cleavage/methylation domain-containing protein